MKIGLAPRRLLAGLPRDFLLLWAGQSISSYGTQLRKIVLPTAAILIFDATPLQVSIIAFCSYVGLLVFGLPSGIWIDRWDRRRVMLVCDAAQTAAVASIPAVFVMGQLSLGVLYVVALINGILDVFFMVAYQSIVPSLVSRDELVRANSRMEFGRAGAMILGPATAGALVSLVAAPLALVVNAATFLASVISLVQIRGPGVSSHRRRRGPFLGELAAGLRVIVQQPVVRATTAAAMTTNLGDAAVMAVLLLFAYRGLGLSPVEVGVVFAFGNAAALAAAALASATSRRFGLGRTMAVCISMTGLCWLLVPLGLVVVASAVLIAALTLRGFATVAWNVMNVSLRQAVTPDALQARVHASIRVLTWGIVPLGSLLGGVLATLLSQVTGPRIGLTLVVVVGGLIAASSVVFLLAGRVYRIRTIGEAEQLVEHAGAEPPSAFMQPG